MTPATTSTTTRRAEVEQYIADGLRPLRLRGWGDFKNRKAPVDEGYLHKTYRPDDWQPREGIGLRLGVQPNGLRLYVLDLDSHGVTQDALKFLNWIHFQTPKTLWRRFFEARSTGEHGRYIAFYSDREIANGTLHTHTGVHAGEFLGEGRYVVAPTPDRWLQGTLQSIPILASDEVDTLLAAAGYRRGNTGGAETGALTEPEGIANIDKAQLLQRLAFVLKPGITRDLIKEQKPITDASAARYTCIRGFMFYGFTDAEIVVLAEELCDWNRAGAALRADVLRCIAKAAATMPNRRIYQPADAAEGGDKKSRRPRGRPKGTIAERLLAYLTRDGEHGSFTDTNEMLAQELRVSERTIMRGLDELQHRRGALKRHYLAHGRVIELTPEGVTKNTAPAVAPEVTIQPIAVPEIASAAAGTEEETRVPPYPPASPIDTAPTVTLAQAVEEARAVYGRYKLSNRVNLIVYHVEANYPGLAPEDAIRREYRRQMGALRRWLFQCDLTVLDVAALREIRAAGRFIAYRGSKGNNRKQYQAGAFVQKRVEDEFKRRGIQLRRASKRRTVDTPQLDVMGTDEESPPVESLPPPQPAPQPATAAPPARSAVDEIHASLVRDLMSWGKYTRALDQAELIADVTYRTAVMAAIRAAQTAGGHQYG